MDAWFATGQVLETLCRIAVELGGTSVHNSGVCRETNYADFGDPHPGSCEDCRETEAWPWRVGSPANISGRVALRGWCLVEPPGLKDCLVRHGINDVIHANSNAQRRKFLQIIGVIRPFP
jgi:hypothetical protein